MSWLYSRALVAAYSAASCSAGTPCAPSSLTPTPRAFSSHARMTAFSRLSRYGMTCAPLTDGHGAALLTWSLAASRARTSASPARARGSAARAAASGRTWRGSLARFDPATRSWKTAQRSLFADSSESWVIWPRSGMTAAGQCWELPTLAHRISATVFGFSLPTPVASDGSSGAVIGKHDRFHATRTGMPRKVNRHGTSGSVGLARLVRMWPAPRSIDLGNPPDRGMNLRLRFRTPLASDGKRSRQTLAERLAKRQQVRLAHQIAAGGLLNPTWVEWLMGWPLGWTDLKPLATDRCRSAPRPPGNCSATVLRPTDPRTDP